MSSDKKSFTPQVFQEVSPTREEIKKIISRKSISSLFWILTGKAGSGKTTVMENLASHEIYPLHSSRLIDKHICTQLLFEALLAKELEQNPLRFIVEDKGRKIAHLSIPDKLLQAWNKAPHFLITAPLEERVHNIYQAHVAGKSVDNAQINFLERSRERMGEALYKKLRRICEAANLEKDEELHKEWIRSFIIEHLDPLFDYYLHHKNPTIQFSGDKDTVTEYLKIQVDRIKSIASSFEEARSEDNSKEKEESPET